MISRKAKMYFDDTGKVGEGTYQEVECVISSDAVSRWQTVEEDCRGDDEVTHAPDRKEYEIPVTLKFVKQNALLERLLAAHNAGSQIGVICSTGDVTPSAANEGHIALEMNGLAEEFTVTKQSGSVVEVNTTIKPHAENTDTTVPRLFTVPAA